MEKYDDGASAGMLGTVYDDMERQIQPGKTVGTTFDRNKVGGFGIYQAEDLVGLYAVENPTEILILLLILPVLSPPQMIFYLTWPLTVLCVSVDRHRFALLLVISPRLSSMTTDARKQHNCQASVQSFSWVNLHLS